MEQLKTQSSRKILLLGLSQVGKTSICDVVFGGKAPEETQRYVPTSNYERRLVQIEEEPFIVMDLGGQEVFLKRFLNSMSSFIFSKIVVLVFICDITTPENFPVSLKAFVEGISRLEEISDVQPAIFVLLHKTDLIPDLIQRIERIDLLMEMFQDAAPTKSIIFLQTSIYDNSIHEAFKRITTEASEVIPEAETFEKEEDLQAIQQRLRFRPIQQVLQNLKITNKLDEILLISLDDPDFLIHSSDTDPSEIDQLITLLKLSDELILPPHTKSEMKRLGSLMMYKTKILPNHLMILISSDMNSILETKQLREIEDAIYLLSDQLVVMLCPTFRKRKTALLNEMKR